MSEAFPKPVEQSQFETARYAERTASATRFSTYRVTLNEPDADAVYARLVEAEQKLASPDRSAAGYDEGVATHEDEIGEFDSPGRAIISTEHATTQRRLRGDGSAARNTKEYEPGLAALGYLMHRDAAATHLTMLGRQTADPNNDPRHPYKDRISRLVHDGKSSFVSIHGMTAGKVHALDDDRAFDAVIGVGQNPSEETMEHAEDAGAKSALQIELSSFLRLLEADNERPERDKVMGAYMGYVLLKNIMETKV